VEFYQEGTIDYEEMSLDLDDISVTVSILKECFLLFFWFGLTALRHFTGHIAPIEGV